MVCEEEFEPRSPAVRACHQCRSTGSHQRRYRPDEGLRIFDVFDHVYTDDQIGRISRATPTLPHRASMPASRALPTLSCDGSSPRKSGVRPSSSKRQEQRPVAAPQIENGSRRSCNLRR